METYQRCKGFPDVRHVDCGGEIASDGSGWVQLPIGFGYGEPGTKDYGRFVVDSVRYPAYSGFCMKCQAEGMFIRADQRGKAHRSRPKGVNRKIAAARLS